MGQRQAAGSLLQKMPTPAHVPSLRCALFAAPVSAVRASPSGTPHCSGLSGSVHSAIGIIFSLRPPPPFLHLRASLPAPFCRGSSSSATHPHRRARPRTAAARARATHPRPPATQIVLGSSECDVSGDSRECALFFSLFFNQFTWVSVYRTPCSTKSVYISAYCMHVR
ncbi:hypothetical protein BC834DRAFT_236466 [Gloeopeniophorella convolvens]|nr:hypothetical protein BC834DRAFT_236466 [Gloeopeniophorella convolvens]